MTDIRKKKTDRPGKWLLVQDGQVVGEATEWHMSATQRRWSARATIDGHEYNVPNTWSVKQAIKEIQSQIQQGVADPADRLAAIRARANTQERTQ